MVAERLADLAAAVRNADQVVALTGAGLSTASGVPDFRSEGGVWETHDPRDFEFGRFRSDPAGFWQDRLALHETLVGEGVEPNPGHEALANLERRGCLEAVVTQNVDGLHRAAGAESVLCLHGTNDRVECRDCGERKPAGPVRERARGGELPPTCEACGGVLKPAVVLFGEPLPAGALERARELVRRSDLVLIAGTSLTVEPAASLPQVAEQTGASLAVINLEETRLSDRATFDFRADVTDVLPALAEAV
ncbi:MAG: NAD-dependent protein deacylase [Haloarculaceae archaeon]